jgi:Beta-lactamase enzyme family
VKQTHAAVVRRRRLAVTVSVVVVATAGIVLATQWPAHSHAHSHPQALSPSQPDNATSAAANTRTLHQILDSYIATRHGAVSVAVYDGVAKDLLVVHPKVRGRTASIVKVDILETLLHQTGGHLSEDQRETATSMIENSDNDSATDLWNQDGGAPGVHAYNDDLGLTQTTPNVDWGLTTTSAADQVTLVRELMHKSTLLTTSGRAFQRRLMRHVEADQRWGISAGPPKTAVVGIKNGWLPVDEDNDLWAVNSIGWVSGSGKHYVIAVITQHDPTMGYGIATIQHISRTVWAHMKVAS